MMNRRHLFNLGLWGSAGAMVSMPDPRVAARDPAPCARYSPPSWTRCPCHLPPRPIDWQPGALPFADLDPEAQQVRRSRAR